MTNTSLNNYCMNKAMCIIMHRYVVTIINLVISLFMQLQNNIEYIRIINLSNLNKKKSNLFDKF